jgi:hypothetical protein
MFNRCFERLQPVVDDPICQFHPDRSGYAAAVRWERLFEDLEAQAAALDDADLRSEVAERTRMEVARLSFAQRLHGAVGGEIGLRLLGGQTVRGPAIRCGGDWVLLAGAEEVLVRHRAVVAATSLPPRATAASGIGVVTSRLSLRAALRAIARDRSRVIIGLVDGTRATGTPDRVGDDWLDLAVHDADQSPRRSEVGMRWTIPLEAVSSVRRPSVHWA